LPKNSNATKPVFLLSNTQSGHLTSDRNAGHCLHHAQPVLGQEVLRMSSKPAPPAPIRVLLDAARVESSSEYGDRCVSCAQCEYCVKRPAHSLNRSFENTFLLKQKGVAKSPPNPQNTSGLRANLGMRPMLIFGYLGIALRHKLPQMNIPDKNHDKKALQEKKNCFNQ